MLSNHNYTYIWMGLATKWEIASPKLFVPPPSRQGKTFFAPPLLKSGNFSRPPYNMAKTSSYLIKTTPKLVVLPPFSMAKTFSAPPPFHRGKTSVPPLPFCRPPLPIISDQSLTRHSVFSSEKNLFFYLDMRVHQQALGSLWTTLEV